MRGYVPCRYGLCGGHGEWAWKTEICHIPFTIYMAHYCDLSQTLKIIPISSIENCNKSETRRDLDIEDLVNSLAKHGQLLPIQVRSHPTNPSKYELIFGNRRLAAARRLGWSTIRAEIVRATDIDVLITALIENIDRKDLCDYEKALSLQEIKEKSKKTYAEVAAIAGKSSSFVSQHIAMLHLFPESVASEEERIKVLHGLTERHSRILGKVEDSVERWNTAKLAVAAKLGVRELERICKKKSVRSRSVDNEIAIRDLLLSINNSFNSKDLNPFFRAISDNSFNVFSEYPPYKSMNSEEYKNHICRIMKRLKSSKMRIKDLNVHVAGNSAYATITHTHEVGAESQDISFITRATIVLAKEEGVWKILHEHWSSPDSGIMLNLLKVADTSPLC